MAIKDLAVAYNRSENSEKALNFAIRMCKEYDAALTGLYVREPISIAPQARPWISDNIMESLRHAGDQAVKSAETHFREAVAAAGFEGEAEWRVEEGAINDILSSLSRYYDLLVIGQFSDSGEKRSRVRAEELVQASGRPLIIVPNSYEVRPFTEYAAVAWDGSRPAARALADAMHILATKQRLDLVQVSSGKAKSPARGSDILRHLGRHGIAVQAVPLTASRDRVGEVILEHCASNDPDVLVMGAYGHARVREELFGGVTRHILRHMNVPVFMAH